MDTKEAKQILERELKRYRERHYLDLVALIDEPERKEITSETGRWYQLEFLAVWDHEPNGDLGVIGSIDDGGWRAFVPLTIDFIKRPDGSFVGE
jgi:hypothetical protein